MLIAAAFLAVGAFVMAHHELWRDKVQTWLLARDSASASDLLTRQKYKSHPVLCQLLLMPLPRRRWQSTTISTASTKAFSWASAQKQFYYPQSKRWRSYIVWDQRRQTRIMDQEIIDAARALSRPSGQQLLLVLSHRLDEGTVRDNHIKALGNFAGAVVTNEKFRLYLLD